MIWIYLSLIAVVAWWAWGEYMPKIRATFTKPEPKQSESRQMSDICRSHYYDSMGETNIDYMLKYYTGALPWLGNRPPYVGEQVMYVEDMSGVMHTPQGTPVNDPRQAGVIWAVHKLASGKGYEVNTTHLVK